MNKIRSRIKYYSFIIIHGCAVNNSGLSCFLIICLPGQPTGRLLSRSESCGKGGMLMSTYEEFMIILTVGLLIVAVLNLKNKK